MAQSMEIQKFLDKKEKWISPHKFESKPKKYLDPVNLRLSIVKSAFDKLGLLANPYDDMGVKKEKLKHLLKLIKNHRLKLFSELQKDQEISEKHFNLSNIFPLINEIKNAKSNLYKWHGRKKLLKSSTAIQFRPIGKVFVYSNNKRPLYSLLSPLITNIVAGNNIILCANNRFPHFYAYLSKIISQYFDSYEVQFFYGEQEIRDSFCQLPFDHFHFSCFPDQLDQKLINQLNFNSSKSFFNVKERALIISKLNKKSIEILGENIARSLIYSQFNDQALPDYILITKDIYPLLLKKIKEVLFKRLGSTTSEQLHSQYAFSNFNKFQFDKTKLLINDIKTNQLGKVEFGGQYDDKRKIILPTIISHVSLKNNVIEKTNKLVLPFIFIEDASQALEFLRPRKIQSIESFGLESKYINKMKIYFQQSILIENEYINTTFLSKNNPTSFKDFLRSTTASFSLKKSFVKKWINPI